MNGAEIETRCGMITGAKTTNLELTWLPDGRNGLRQYRLTADDHTGHIRTMRLTANEVKQLGQLMKALTDKVRRRAESYGKEDTNDESSR